MYDIIAIQETGEEKVMSTFDSHDDALDAIPDLQDRYMEWRFYIEVNARHAAEQHQKWLWENGYEDFY